MAFRGRPSKACARCRARRAKCDLRSGACGQCIRASVPCSGYRDTEQLRIRDESQSVARKALKGTPACKLQYLPIAINLQARAAFFDNYVTSKCWNFLMPYHHLLSSPDHLASAIEAVSLAYLWYHVQSDTALATARERYVSALRILKKVLKSPKEAIKESTLMTSLLLDLFEKMTERTPRNNQSWSSHVDGALALVQLRGLEQFRKPSELEILVRLSGNYLASSIASGSPIPDGFNAIQAHINQNLDFRDPKLQLSDMMFEYANVCNEVRKGILSDIELIRASVELDDRIKGLDLKLPSRWQYSTVFLEHKSERSFDLYFDFYSVPRVCQARNVLRVLRVLLNRTVVERCSALSANDRTLTLVAIARENIETLAREICASVPQYVDCDDVARQRLTTSGAGHYHTYNHKLDVYTLIFPLYVVGSSKGSSDLRHWVIKQLHYIGSHFHIRNAEVVAQILERETDGNPWEIYAMLGSYAFQA